MQISITGGSGYLAGRICKFFSKNLSNKIFLISRTPEKHLVSKNIFAISLSDKSAFEQCISSSDIIIFTAGYNSHMASRDPNGAIQFAQTSIKEVSNLINRNTTLIYLSTAHVYKNPLVGEIDENTNLENMHPYALANITGEKSLIKLAKDKNLREIILRVSNCFGMPANQSKNCWNLVLNEMCLNAIQKKLIHITGPENSIRNFLPIRTFLYQLEFLIKSKKGEYPNIINLGHTRSFSIIEIANIVKNRCKHLFDFEPLIKVNQNNQDFFQLNYKSRYLKHPSNVEENFFLELDEMLLSINNKKLVL